MIIDVFSPVWFMLAALGALLTAGLARLMKGKGRKQKLRLLERLSILTCVFWVIYKTALGMDASYDFKLMNELPLHLCNVSTMLAVVAARNDNRTLQAFLFFCGTIGALLACLTPDPAFAGVSFLLPRCLGYWLYHVAMVVLPCAFVALHVYRPVVRDVPRALLTLLGIGIAMFFVNLVLRATVFPGANYCYSFGMPGNPITDLLQRYIPIPVVFMLPMIPLLGVVDLLMLLPFYRGRAYHATEEQEAAELE